MTVQAIENPLSMQERLKDMQTLLILKSIRAQHDSDANVLKAIDHAIRIIEDRHERRKKEGQDSFQRQFAADVLAMVDRGEGYVADVGVDREAEMISVNSISGQSHSIPGREQMTYTIKAVGVLKR